MHSVSWSVVNARSAVYKKVTAYCYRVPDTTAKHDLGIVEIVFIASWKAFGQNDELLEHDVSVRNGKGPLIRTRHASRFGRTSCRRRTNLGNDAAAILMS